MPSNTTMQQFSEIDVSEEQSIQTAIYSAEIVNQTSIHVWPSNQLNRVHSYPVTL